MGAMPKVGGTGGDILPGRTPSPRPVDQPISLTPQATSLRMKYNWALQHGNAAAAEAIAHTAWAQSRIDVTSPR